MWRFWWSLAVFTFTKHHSPPRQLGLDFPATSLSRRRRSYSLLTLHTSRLTPQCSHASLSPPPPINSFSLGEPRTSRLNGGTRLLEITQSCYIPALGLSGTNEAHVPYAT
ncbi:hypothetical protein LX36DRAFT_662064 [Colletotrichum falcatum]|nr:hypothetical protein LX36DRAFT_662064 [Colletotrichum falcatum]